MTSPSIWNSVFSLRSQGRPHWACPPHPGWSTVCRQEGLFLRESHLGSRVSGLALPDFYLQGRQDWARDQIGQQTSRHPKDLVFNLLLCLMSFLGSLLPRQDPPSCLFEVKTPKKENVLFYQSHWHSSGLFGLDINLTPCSVILLLPCIRGTR
ncbi:uncharacterized protein WM294_002018 [Sarcoramphus papa]